MWLHARKPLTKEWDIFQGERCEDLAMDDDLADTDARVSKYTQILLESTFLLQIGPTWGEVPLEGLHMKANLKSSKRTIVPNVHSLNDAYLPAFKRSKRGNVVFMFSVDCTIHEAGEEWERTRRIWFVIPKNCFVEKTEFLFYQV